MEPTVTGTVTSATGGKESKSVIVQNIVDVAHGGLLAYAKVYESLEDSGKILGNSLKENSVKIVPFLLSTMLNFLSDIFKDTFFNKTVEKSLK